MVARVRALGAEHERAIMAPLTPAERDQLADMLHRLADAEGLAPGIHPGLRKLR